MFFGAAFSVLRTDMAYSQRSADVFFRMNTGEQGNILSNKGIRLGDALSLVLLCIPLGIILRKLRTCFEPNGAKAAAQMEDTAISYRDINPDTVQAVMFLKEELRKVNAIVSEMKTLALLPIGNTPIARKKSLFARVRVTTTQDRGTPSSAISVGTDAFMGAHAEKTMKDDVRKHLARLLVGKPHEQVELLAVTKSMTENTYFLEWGLDIDFFQRCVFPGRPRRTVDAGVRPRTLGSSA